MEGYCVIQTTYTYVSTLEAARELALFGRGEGKRTEVITQQEYLGKHAGRPMQDLTKLKATNA